MPWDTLVGEAVVFQPPPQAPDFQNLSKRNQTESKHRTVCADPALSCLNPPQDPLQHMRLLYLQRGCWAGVFPPFY